MTAFSWWWPGRLQSAWLPSGRLLQGLLPAAGICFLLGLALRLAYYCWLHPSRPLGPDQVDGTWGLRLP